MKNIFLISLFLLMLVLSGCSSIPASPTPVANIVQGISQTVAPVQNQLSSFAWPPFPTTPNITTWYLWALADATLIVGIDTGFKALLLAVLLVQFVTGLVLFLFTAVLTGLIYKGPRGPEYSFKTAAIVGAVIVIAEALMTMLAPGGTWVFICELGFGILMFAISHHYGFSHEENERTEASYDEQGHPKHTTERSSKTAIKASTRSKRSDN